MTVQYIDGAGFSGVQMKSFLRSQKEPVVITNMVENWPVINWSIEKFAEEFGNIETNVKLYKRNAESDCKKQKLDSVVVMETDCFHVKCSIRQFVHWIMNKGVEGELAAFSYNHYWGYVDYNYMIEFFKDYPYILKDVNWGNFGYPERNGFQSTFWFGSMGSFTPCHQDVYGTNLVAQILGIKEWLLFPPIFSKILQPTRIPYEESTIFSKTDVTSYSQYGIKVRLQPGDVLYVPKHWWHYVKNETNSISINTWLEEESDSYDRICEALVKLVVFSMKKCEGTSLDKWLNPKEELPKTFSDCLELLQLALKERFVSTKVKSLEMQVFEEKDSEAFTCPNNACEKCTAINKQSDFLQNSAELVNIMLKNTKGNNHPVSEISGRNSCAMVNTSNNVLNHFCDSVDLDCDFLVNCFADREVLDKVVAVIFKKMKKTCSH